MAKRKTTSVRKDLDNNKKNNERNRNTAAATTTTTTDEQPTEDSAQLSPPSGTTYNSEEWNKRIKTFMYKSQPNLAKITKPSVNKFLGIATSKLLQSFIHKAVEETKQQQQQEEENVDEERSKTKRSQKKRPPAAPTKKTLITLDHLQQVTYGDKPLYYQQYQNALGSIPQNKQESMIVKEYAPAATATTSTTATENAAAPSKKKRAATTSVSAATSNKELKRVAHQFQVDDPLDMKKAATNTTANTTIVEDEDDYD
jgi:hypothetical protein